MTNENGSFDEEATIRRPPRAAEAAPAKPTRLLCSVGRNGVNRPEDVVALRGLINAGRPSPLLPATLEGRCDSDLIAAIDDFQTRVMGLQPASGRVEPDGPVLRALIGD